MKRLFLTTALALSLACPAISFAGTGTSGSGAAPTATSTNCTAASKQSDLRGTEAQGGQPGAVGGGEAGLGKQQVEQPTVRAGNAEPGKLTTSGPLTPCG